jgi:hypothetical protein
VAKKIVVERKSDKSATQGFHNCGSGEYLGDVEVTDAFFETLVNVNPHANRINQVPRGTYCLTGYFDLADGHLVGLGLEPDGTDSCSKHRKHTTKAKADFEDFILKMRQWEETGRTNEKLLAEIRELLAALGVKVVA